MNSDVMLHKNLALAATVVVAALSACGGAPETASEQRYPFDTNKIQDVEKVMDGLATTKGLRVFRKDQAQMATLTQNKPAFFTALYADDDVMLVVTNVGVSETLVIHAIVVPGRPRQEAEGIAREAEQLIRATGAIRGVNAT